MSNVIDVSAEKGKFVIHCPFVLAAHLRDIPGKRWSSPRKAYIVPFSRKAAEVLSAVQVDIVFDKHAIEMMAMATHAKPPPMPFPEYTFKTDPMKHQVKALDFLWGKTEAALFMAMRTGKTKTVIDWACALKMYGHIDHLLVFCPLSVRGSWEKQIAEHGTIDMKVARYDLSTKSGQRAQKAFTENVNTDHLFKAMIVGIESMAAGGAYNWVYDYIAGNGRVLCVVDESHLIKTHNATRSEKITQLGTICSHRVILTGTPITASPLDLYSQFNFLNPDIIGFNDFYSFKNRYAIMGGYENRQIVGYNNIDELMADISPYTYQVKAEEVADLPPKIYMVREVELPAKARAMYNLIKKHKIVEYEGKELILSNALDRLTRLSMLTTGSMATGESGEYEYYWINAAKVNELMNLIEENPTPTVIWTTGKTELRKIVEELNSKGIKTAEIHGGVKEDDRIKAVADFQDGKIDYLVSNVSTGGTGIKLSRAKMLVYMSNSFKYVDRKQSEERATDFINVGESVLVVDIVAVDTVDSDVIQSALQSKQDIAYYVRDKISELKLSEGL